MKGKLKIITAMLIFGSIAVFVRNINLSSSEIAFLRGIIGSIFLIIASFFSRERISFVKIKNNIKLLILSGSAIGVNWIFLFQAYKYTTISNATLSYYFAPIVVVILSPIILKEKLTPLKMGCVITAMIGLFLVVDINGNGTSNFNNQLVGILYGLFAAVLYASVILMNKFIENLSGFETTLVQLMVATIVLLPYVLIKDQMNFTSVSFNSFIYIMILGIVHTGFAYYLYFTAIKKLKGHSIAVLSYIDPISAVIIASIFLGEKMSSIQAIGGILILGATFLSESQGR